MSQPSVPSDWPRTPPTDTPAPSNDVSRTSGLASGLCIALAIIIGLTVYVLRGRIFPFGGRVAATPPRRSDTLTPEALALLPIHIHDAADLAETSSVSGAAPGPNDRCCSVCTEPFMHGVQLRKLPCGHQFDRACIDPWLLKRSATCPLCQPAESHDAASEDSRKTTHGASPDLLPAQQVEEGRKQLKSWVDILRGDAASNGAAGSSGKLCGSKYTQSLALRSKYTGAKTGSRFPPLWCSDGNG
ncbi:Zinc finger, RING/FYVE/PHD-type [Metarhizium guizhouense ARSEF 977]|uniref:Zinc finger, RING/FYVE/PHD-type n=1 Tax=Metarhizium guizhouense (strain ARSEF 977) TaxID=1276136 RepID=A0A0B4HT28_METGA|nr:Zinc finger, RING/FYVE/PHD-type [Metarhizium guizhouense ARSEF 977]